jgi:hypothetical protein
MAETETLSDRAVFGFFDLLGLMLVLPMGDALYRNDSITLRMAIFAVTGFGAAVFGHSWPKIKTSARIPLTLRQSVGAVASDFRWWLVVLLFGFALLALPQSSPFAPFDLQIPRHWIAALIGAGLTAVVFSIITALQGATGSKRPERQEAEASSSARPTPLIAIQSPSGGSVPTWAIVEGFASPTPALVQVLVEAGPINQRLWYVQGDARVTRYGWKARCRFGDQNSQTGWGFRFCAVIPKTRLVGTVREIPADAVVSEIIYVTLDRTCVDENFV